MDLRIKGIQVDELDEFTSRQVACYKEKHCFYVTLALLAVDEFTSKQVACYKKIKTCSYALSSFAINLLTCQLVASSTYLVTLSLFAVDMSLRN